MLIAVNQIDILKIISILILSTAAQAQSKIKILEKVCPDYV